MPWWQKTYHGHFEELHDRFMEGQFSWMNWGIRDIFNNTMKLSLPDKGYPLNDQKDRLKLLAPCGMDCALCSKYLAHQNDLNLAQCPGCRARNEPCSYLFGKCIGPNHGLPTGSVSFCYECDEFPCKDLKRMDKRYWSQYHMSVIHNLNSIRKHGSAQFRALQDETYQCNTCQGLISIHNQKCFVCDPATRLVEKSPTAHTKNT